MSRFSCRTSKEFKKETKLYAGVTLFESDIKPVNRCLENKYRHIDPPTLHVAFVDIESDFDQVKGYAPTEDPFNSITAITVYLNWTKQLITFAIPPKTLSTETAQQIARKFDNTIVFDTEKEMLEAFLDVIDDADVLSGWNSESYDIPYTVNRVNRVLSKDDTRRFCLWDQYPKLRTFERYGGEHITFDLVGRIHLDYMQLYTKYTYEERHSYSLDSIAEYELGENKVAYEGTLDQLYNQDFERFLDYNRQDVLIIAKLDEKLKFIDLVNNLAHENTVLLPTTMGTVAVTEQAIINESHDRGMVVPSRTPDTGEDTQAAGAYVAYPKKGMHDWIGSIDINSLYPSAIRALNMGPETIVGQLRPTMTDQLIQERMSDKFRNGKKYKGDGFAKAWEGLFATLEYTAVMERRDTKVTLDWADGTSDELLARDVWTLVFESNQPWMISANGTIFTFEKEGVIPGLLARWYSERKELQAKLAIAIDEGDKKQEEYWDKRQLIKKINLNSLYGALLNSGCRFFDKRIGQSTTLSGRSIARHMNAYVNECITGSYDHVGTSIIYSDTDSSYFSAWPAVKESVERGELEWDRDVAIQLYDSIADKVNASFAGFAEQAFHCPQARGKVLKCGREIVASRGLYITKKRYAVLYYDKDGKRCDSETSPGKIKAMGLDLKRSDTPKQIQKFLYELLHDVLTGSEKAHVIEKVLEFKKQFKSQEPWMKGSPKRVNNMTSYGVKAADETYTGMIPGHVRGSLNWNTLRKMHNDNYVARIVDGMKVIVCKLKPNPMGWTAIAYPTDEQHLPEWFKELPFDTELMETNVIDKKVDNLLGVLDWGINDATDLSSTFGALFEF